MSNATINDTPGIPDFNRKYVIVNDIPPRLQWENNRGYCGETAMISAGLYYGQYISQYDARLMASYKNQDGDNQLLLGKNDTIAARTMRLEYVPYISQDSRSFMEWVKQQVNSGYPVIIGVFNNEFRLDEDQKNPLAGDKEYDHIVPVIGFGSNEPLTEKFNETDKLLISDNGLYTPGKTIPYYFEYEMSKFFSDRREANAPHGNMYSLLELPEYKSAESVNNYAIVITGVIGHEETLPVRIKTNFNYEKPAIEQATKTDPAQRPAPMALTLTVTVSDLVPKTDYYLFRYNDENDVPFTDFIANSSKASRSTINIDSGTSYTFNIDIMSNQKVFFRAVVAK
jgi:hypothetical protein